MTQLRKNPPKITPEEYLEGEKLADVRHEYVDGFVYAMSSMTEAHSDIKFNLTLWLGARLPKGCRLFNGDVKLQVSDEATAFYYPDVFLSCSPRAPKEYVRREAFLVIEILSPTTERIDRGEKFHAYTAMPSVQEYVLVSQDGAHVEVFRRRTGWQRETFASADSFVLDSIGANLPVAEIYRDIPL